MTYHNIEKFNTCEVAWKCAALKWNRPVLASFFFFPLPGCNLYNSRVWTILPFSLQRIQQCSNQSSRREMAFLCASWARTPHILNTSLSFFLVNSILISEQWISEGWFLSLCHFISTHFYRLPHRVEHCAWIWRWRTLVFCISEINIVTNLGKDWFKTYWRESNKLTGLQSPNSLIVNILFKPTEWNRYQKEDVAKQR